MRWQKLRARLQSALSRTTKPSNSVDWVTHNHKRLKTLRKQLADFGIANFDWRKYLKDEHNG
jgi:hypothetical protein